MTTQKNEKDSFLPENILEKTAENIEKLTFEVEEEEQEGDKKVKRRGIYLVPNFITTMSLFSGFYSILASTQDRFQIAIICIFISAVLDGLDGRVARLLGAQSTFGEQFDSLTDMLAFGVAPAMLVYSWALEPLNRLGITSAFVFTACAAFRLARFNAQIGEVDKKYFIGLASPLAAILLTSVVMVGIDIDNGFDVTQQKLQIFIALVTVIIGLLMVSNLKYNSFKEFDKKRVPFMVLPVFVLMISIITYDIPIGILSLCILYALSGIWTSLNNN